MGRSKRTKKSSDIQEEDPLSNSSETLLESLSRSRNQSRSKGDSKSEIKKGKLADRDSSSESDSSNTSDSDDDSDLVANKYFKIKFKVSGKPN